MNSYYNEEVGHLCVEVGLIRGGVGRHVPVLPMPTITFFPSSSHTYQIYNTFRPLINHYSKQHATYTYPRYIPKHIKYEILLHIFNLPYTLKLYCHVKCLDSLLYLKLYGGAYHNAR